jgi:hypothetical protein
MRDDSQSGTRGMGDLKGLDRHVGMSDIYSDLDAGSACDQGPDMTIEHFCELVGSCVEYTDIANARQILINYFNAIYGDGIFEPDVDFKPVVCDNDNSDEDVNSDRDGHTSERGDKDVHISDCSMHDQGDI